MICDRCGVEGRVSIMSKFNRDLVCLDCIKDEKDAPGFAFANDAEFRATLAGNTNYPGVGLSDADRRFLALRRMDRTKE